MNFIKTVTAAALLFGSVSTFATTFTSGVDDTCVGCTLTSSGYATWTPLTGVLSESSWIYDDTSWYQESDYTITDTTLTNSTSDSILTSLSLSFDDQLVIVNDGVTIFDSVALGVTHGWNVITDVYSYLSGTTYISAGSSLEFYLHNSGVGPSGIVYSGTTTSVPEPSMVIALGLGLVAFGVRRRKNTNV